MEGSLLVIYLILTFATTVITDTKPCLVKQENNGPPLPKLDPQFTAIVEAKILQKSMTVVITEYYDFPNNRGAVYKTQNGSTAIWLYNFQRYESFQIEKETCNTSDMRTSIFNFFGFDAKKNGGHIVGVVDLFNFGTKYNETFVKGNETIRGIPVNHWTSCILWEKFYDAEFRLDYYFSTDDYKLTPGRRPIPIRAVLTGIGRDKDTLGRITGGNHTFNHIYDFVSYQPGPIKDQTVFEVPKGVVCKHLTPMKKRPVIPNEFQLHMEEIHPDRLQSSLSSQYFDYRNKLVRHDAKTSLPHTMTVSRDLLKRPQKIIHDYNTGLEYVDDGENCSVQIIPVTGEMFDSKNAAHDPLHVQMRHGYEIMDLNKVNFTYSGQRIVRGITCDVWAGRKFRWPQADTNTTIEIYFTQENWTTDDVTSNQVLVGIWKRMESEKKSYEYTSHIFGFTGILPDVSVFNIGGCYAFAKTQKRLMFRIPGTYDELVTGRPECLQRAVMEEVAKCAGISPIRVNNIHFGQTSSGYVNVWFTVLEKPDLIGSAAKPVPQISLEEAVSHLHQKIESSSGLIITVQYTIDEVKHLKVIKGSLKIDNEAGDSNKSSRLCHIKDGYSSGSMAGLGIAMLLVGAVFGLVAAFFLWKRGSGIAYQVYN